MTLMRSIRYKSLPTDFLNLQIIIKVSNKGMGRFEKDRVISFGLTLSIKNVSQSLFYYLYFNVPAFISSLFV